MELDDEWQPDVVVGVDFGMTCTGTYRKTSLKPECE